MPPLIIKPLVNSLKSDIKLFREQKTLTAIRVWIPFVSLNEDVFLLMAKLLSLSYAKMCEQLIHLQTL